LNERSSMRVSLQVSVCDGFGTCARHLPQVFALDEWGYAALVGDGEVPAGSEELARRAVIDCPVHAIAVVDDTAAAS
jgi:ferredoxin